MCKCGKNYNQPVFEVTIEQVVSKTYRIVAKDAYQAEKQVKQAIVEGFTKPIVNHQVPALAKQHISSWEVNVFKTKVTE